MLAGNKNVRRLALALLLRISTEVTTIYESKQQDGLRISSAVKDDNMHYHMETQ